MQRAASYSRTEAEQSKTYALIGSLLLLGLSYVLLLAAPVVSRQLRSFAGGHTNLGAIESWLPAACVSGLVLGGGAALMFVLVQIAREAERRPYVCLAPVLAAFSACVLIGLRAELPLQGVSAEHVAVFALAVSVAGGALVQDPRLAAQFTGVLLTLLPPLSLIGVLWANSGKSDPATAMWTLSAQARAFLTMLTVTSFGIAIIAIVGRRGARTYSDPSLSAPEYLFDPNWSGDELALRRRGMPGWLLAMLSAAAVGLVFVGFKVALDARAPLADGQSSGGTLDALKRLVVAAPASAPTAQPAGETPKPAVEAATQDAKPVVAALPDSPEAIKPAPEEAPKAEARVEAKTKTAPAPAPVAKAAPAARHAKAAPARPKQAKAAVLAKAPAPAKPQPVEAAKPEPAQERIAAKPEAAPAKAAPAKPEPVKAERPAKPEPVQQQAVAARAPEPDPPAKPKPSKGDESLDDLMDNVVKGKGKNVAIGAKDDPIFGL